MDKLQEIYYELGKLDVITKNAKKSYFLLPMIVRQGVQMLNFNSRVIDFEALFSPDVGENPSKEVLLVVKFIKMINELSAKETFDIETIKTLCAGFKRNIDLTSLKSVDFKDVNINNFYEIFKTIYDKKDVVTGMIICAIFNIYLVKLKLLSFPLFDISNAIKNSKEITDIETFYDAFLFATKSSMSIIEKHKALIKEDRARVQKNSMKSVIAEYEYIIENPVVEVGSMLDDLDMTFATLSKATKILEDDGVLLKIAGSQRYRIFKYKALCDLFSN